MWQPLISQLIRYLIQQLTNNFASEVFIVFVFKFKKPADIFRLNENGKIIAQQHLLRVIAGTYKR